MERSSLIIFEEKCWEVRRWLTSRFTLIRNQGALLKLFPGTPGCDSHLDLVLSAHCPVDSRQRQEFGGTEMRTYHFPRNINLYN